MKFKMNKDEILFNLEKEIQQKYGQLAIKNPKADWNLEKEADFLQQIKNLSSLEYSKGKQEYEELEDGSLVPSQLFIKENDKLCDICGKYSFKKQDDLYLNKYQTCFVCFLEKIEGREDKWKEKQSQKKN